MRSVPEEFRQELLDEIADKSVLSAKVGCLMIIILYPIFGVLDSVLYPEIATSLIIARLIVTALEICNLFIVAYLEKRDIAKNWIRPLSWSIIYPAAIGLDYIVLVAGGAESPYYAGLNLILLGVMAALPWPPREMAANILFIWILYVLIMLGFGPSIDSWATFIGNNFFMVSTIIIGMGMHFIGYELRIQEFLSRKELAQEKERSDKLLLNILPEQVADELKQKGHVEARLCPSATILFTDFVGFTSFAERATPAELVRSLHQLFTAIDEIITRHGLEKLKTIGDAYMCVGGLPVQRPNHQIACVLASLEVLDFLDTYGEGELGGTERWQARIGIHTGPVIAGVIGNRKFAYDVWGDTVNLASRLEASSEPERINVTTDTFLNLDPFFVGKDRGFLPVKGKGPVPMTFVERLRPEYSADKKGYYPNQRFWMDLQVYDSEADVQAATPKVPLFSATVNSRSRPMRPDLWNQLQGLSDQDKERLCEIAESFEFGKDDEIVTQGQQLDALIVVVEGHVSVRLNQEDTRIEVSILGGGDLFGEMSYVTGSVTSASIVGLEKGIAARIRRKDIEAVVREDVGFASRLHLSLAILMAGRLKETTTRLPSLIVEEVAHTKLHHSTITGKVGMNALPPAVVEGVEGFKQGMWSLDRDLLKSGGEASEEHYERAAALCDGLKVVLTRGIKAVEDKGEAYREGVGTYVFRETFPYFMLSRMIDRSFSKPRGYAGDYYTIELIHHNKPEGDSRLGPLIDRHYLESLPSRAVRNRRKFMAEALLERYRQRPDAEAPFLVTSLASGAGRELTDFLGNVPADYPVSTTCIDIDPQALTYGGHLAKEMGLSHQIVFAKENVIHLALGRGHTRLPAQDVIYSMGLLDYLKDKLVIRLFSWIHRNLKPGGVAVIGNFIEGNPEKDFMDHILDWRLYHRSAEDMQRLFWASEFGEDAQVDVKVEGAGVNLMVFCHKHAE